MCVKLGFETSVSIEHCMLGIPRKERKRNPRVRSMIRVIDICNGEIEIAMGRSHC